MQLGAGNDMAVGGNGADTIDGGAGNDNLPRAGRCRRADGPRRRRQLRRPGRRRRGADGGADQRRQSTAAEAPTGSTSTSARRSRRERLPLPTRWKGRSPGLTVVAFESLAGATNLGSAFNEAAGIGAAFTGARGVRRCRRQRPDHDWRAATTRQRAGPATTSLGGGGGTNTLTGGIGNDSYVVENLTHAGRGRGRGTDIGCLRTSPGGLPTSSRT